jgi:hypothetical protein
MNIAEREKIIIKTIIVNGLSEWLVDHYKYLGWNILDLEEHVYKNVPEYDWHLGFIICLYRYIMGLAALADCRARGCANDNSWFNNPHEVDVSWARFTPVPISLPKISYDPFKRISRPRQWQSEEEFRAILPDLCQPPQRASESDRD